MNWALDHPTLIIAISVVTVLLTFPLNRMVGREFVPNEDMGDWTIHVDAPEGTSLEGTTEVSFKLLKEISGIEGVAQIEPSIGVTGMGASSPTHIHFLCQALPIEDRKNSQAEIITEMRRRLAAYPSYRPSITSRNALGSGEGQTGFPISVNILGPDLGQIAEYSKRALEAAQRLPSLTEAKINLNISNPEVHVAVDRKRAADLGVRMSTVGNTLRLAVSGDDQISFYKEGTEQYPVKIRVREDQRRDIEEIGRLTVPSANGPIRIDNIARIERGLGPTTLQRSNRQFTVMLNADVAPGHALDEAANDVRRMLTGLNMPPTMSFRLQGQSKILDETTTNLMMAIGLAMIFVYMVLASQFESFLQPIVIMLVLPIAVPFALFTLWITGSTLNLWSALGMLLLLGIVKKNSILQVDYANVLRARGMPLREAIVESCRTRLRPILMTTTAIIAGLIPTSLGIGIGGTGRAAIALTIIGGQSLCLFLTLLLVPVAYVKFDALERALVGDGARRWLARVSAECQGPFPSGARPRHDSGRSYSLPLEVFEMRSAFCPFSRRCRDRSCHRLRRRRSSPRRPGPRRPPVGFTALFNGKDLSGWRGRPGGGGVFSPYVEAKFTPEEREAKRKEWNADRDLHWSVDAATGELVSDGKGVHLATEKPYGDFEFRVDWKLMQAERRFRHLPARFPAGADLGSGECRASRRTAPTRVRAACGTTTRTIPGAFRWSRPTIPSASGTR